jgi:hypothetical protein
MAGALGLAALALASPAAGAAARAATSASRPAPQFSQGHAWRNGVVPMRGHRYSQSAGTRLRRARSSRISRVSSNNLSFGGGVDAVGVTTGAPKVYLVFWGSQWGAQRADSQGYATFSGDPSGMAPALQAFFAGLGTGSETWSGVMTQYCQGVTVGAQTCPASNAERVGYPTGGALAGVWEDTSATAPQQASAHQIAQEAVAAATHFGNTTQASNRNAQYFVVSPTGTYPDGFGTSNGQFCAWHDYTGDSTMDGGGAVSSPGGELAFTNMPYVTDAGYSCGEDFVNSGQSGLLDGVTIVGGHEYAETITDQYPAGGWLDSSGEEAGDKCAWISSGSGASQDITLTTGSFAVQSIWANDDNNGSGGCEISHPILTDGGGANVVSVTNPGSQSSTVGQSVSLQIHAGDSGTATLSYSASGMPPGLTINRSTGLISGKPTSPGNYSVNVIATDSTNASGSTTFSWSVSSAAGGCTAAQLLGNPGFETGAAAPWTASPGVIVATSSQEPARSGSYLAWLEHHTTQPTSLAQEVALPLGCSSYAFSFWRHIDTSERPRSAYDTLKVEVLSSSGQLLRTLATFSNLDANSGYVQQSYNLASYAGQTITLKFLAADSDRGGGTTNFTLDDTALNLS